MKSVVYKPAPPLDYFIDTIWFNTSDSFTSAGITLPLLHHELMFNFSEYFAIIAQAKKQSVVNLTHWLGGFQTLPTAAFTQGKHESIGIMFKPWGLQPLTNIPAIELLNSTVSAELIFGEKIIQLSDKIYTAHSITEKCRVLEQFLLQQYQNKKLPSYIPYSYHLLKNAKVEDGITSQLAKELKITPKSLIQAYKKYMGITPNKLFHLQQLNQVLATLAALPRQSLTELTYNYQYFDQSHFNHIFKSYTTLTPSQYQQMLIRGNIDPCSPNYIATQERLILYNS